MYLSIIDVKPLENYKLLLTFENREEKVFDVLPLMKIGKFSELKDKKLFNTVKVSFDTIEWQNHLDIDPEMLYRQGKTIISK